MMQTAVYEKDNPHSTHYPLLEYVANITNGKYIEFGSGYGSTPLLYKIAHEKRGKLFSFENNPFFVNKFFPDNDLHFMINEVNWNTFFTSPLWLELSQQHFDLIFVDSAPFEARLVAIDHCKDICDYLILHDSDWFLWTKTIDSWSQYFKYYKKYNVIKKPYKTGPPTALFSNTISELEFNISGMYIE